MNDCVLEVKELTKTYKNGRGVTDISFTIEQGDIWGLLGPNGSGKTTIMKMLTGLISPEKGSIHVLGKNAFEDRVSMLHEVGCLIEEPALFEYLSAEKNLLLATRFYAHIGRTAIDDILSQTGLLAYKKEKVKHFSLGMKQRLGLALALISEPKLVILDEPVNGLDIEGMVSIREIIIDQAQNKGITFLVSSHLSHEIELMCNKVGIIKEGKLIDTAFMKDALLENGTLEKHYLNRINAMGVTNG